jgi:hypothetical protein
MREQAFSFYVDHFGVSMVNFKKPPSFGGGFMEKKKGAARLREHFEHAYLKIAKKLR